MDSKQLSKILQSVFATAMVLACGGQACAEGKVRAILVTDTEDGSIGIGIKENLKNIKEFLERVEVEGDLEVTRIEVADQKFSCTAIRQTVSNVEIKNEDAVLFYYSGHGFRRNSTQTKFPEFDCRRSRLDTATDMDYVVKALLARKPQLLIAVADTCNVPVELAPVRGPKPAVLGGPERKAGFRRLLLGYSGALIMSGSIPGEFSWYMNGPPSPGGFFTNQFLTVINQRLSRDAGNVRWEDIATDATKPIFVPLVPNPAYQQPQQAALNLAPITEMK